MTIASSRFFSTALAALAALTVGVVLFAPQVLGDGDTYWHLAVGAWILAKGQIPQVDTFSYTMTGHPWMAQEWLSEVAMATAFRLGGWSGLMILLAAATGGTVILLGLHLRRWLDPAPALISVGLALSLLSPSLLARPHLLALPVMEFWCAALVIARDRGHAPSVWLLPLMVLWTNLHASFPVGLVLAGLLTVEAFETDRKQGMAWVRFTLAAIVSTLINPRGIAGAIFPLHLMNSGAVAGIIEWQSANFAQNPPIAAVLVLVLYLSLVRGFRLEPMRFVIFAGLLYAALLHTRNQMLFGIVGVPVIAPALGRFLGRSTKPAMSEVWQTSLGFVVTGCVLALVRVADPLVRGDDWVTPQTALAHVPISLRSAPVFNDDSLGGYLIFEGVRPFIDGRADLYGPDFNMRYWRSLNEPGPLFAQQLASYGIKWALVSTRSPAVAAFSSLPAWHCLYAGRTARVYVRN